MGALTGSTISSSYDMLLKTATTGGVTGTLKVIEDGLGIDSALKLSTSTVSVNGSLGVGTEDTSTAHAAYSNIVVGESSDALSGMTFRSTTTGSSAILFTDGVSSYNQGKVIYDHDTATMTLGAEAGDAIVIDSSNNVGIGGTPSTHPLEIHSTDSACVLADSSAADSWSQFRLNSGNQDWRITSYGESYSGDTDYQSKFSIFGGDSTGTLAHRLVIDSDGEVGIATSSPSTGTHSSYRNLVIGETTDSTSGLSFKASTAGSSAIFFSNGATPFNRGQIIYDHDDDSMAFSSSGTEAMRIASDGNCGIGGIPAVPLDIFGDDADDNINSVINCSDSRAMAAGVGGGISFFGKYTTGGSYSIFGHIKAGKESGTTGEYGGYLSFSTRPSDALPVERMRISADGNCGIGCDPSTPLHIQSANTTGGMCLIRNTAGTAADGSSVLEVRSDDASDIGAHDLLNLNNQGNIKMLVQADGVVIIPSMPDADPGVAGALYHSSGTVMISL